MAPTPSARIAGDAVARQEGSRPPVLFTRRPDPAQVLQSFWVDDCYLMAPLQTLAARYPGVVVAAVQPTPTGVRVRGYNEVGGEPLYVGLSVSARRPAAWLRCGTRGSELWPACIEQAYAAVRRNPLHRHARSSTDMALLWLLGCQTRCIPVPTTTTPACLVANVAKLHERGECVVLVARGHAMSVLNVSYREGRPVALQRGNTWPKYYRHDAWRMPFERIYTTVGLAKRIPLLQEAHSPFFADATLPD